MKKKYLILSDDWFYDFHLRSDESSNYDIYPMLKGNLKNKIIRSIRKIHLSSLLPLKSIWISNELKNIDKYETVILGDAGNTFNIAKYIRKKDQNIRIIIWYRNTYAASSKLPMNYSNVCEVWSFDLSDCNKYKFKYNPQFLLKYDNLNNNVLINGAFFIGQDKGRKEELLKLKKILDDYNIENSINIIGYNSEQMPYDSVILNIKKYLCIIDFQCDWQEGITLRPLEALFYDRKLITNNINIKKFDFYNKQNIFIFGYDDPKLLPNFFNTPVIKQAETIKKKYGLESWINKFGSN